MLRRVTTAIAAAAIVLSGLAWGATPASAAVSSASISPSSWSVGTSEAATISWTESVTRTSVMVRSPWPWPNSYTGTVATPSSIDASSVTGSGSGPYTITCPKGVFTVSGTVTAPISCKTANSPGNPNFFTAFWIEARSGGALSVTGAISVTLAAGTVTAPSSARTDTWIIGQYDTSNTASGIATAGNVEVATTSVATDSAGNPIPLITINIDANGGRCNVNIVTGFQSTWTTAPNANSCARADSVFTGFNTSSDGSGLAIAPSGDLNLTGDNTLYAQYGPLRVAGAPTDVVATGGYKNVKVSWQAPSDPGTSSIGAYLVQTDTGRTCITRVPSENPLECTYSELTPGTKYTFKVQALNRAGWGNFSAASNAASPYDVKLDVLSRPEVKFLFFKRGSNLEAEGRAPGLAAGTVLTPVMQIGTDGAFVPLAKDTTKVNGDSAFSWSRKLDKKDNGKPVSLYFTYGDAKTSTLTAKLGATIGLPSAPRDVKVKSDTSGFTVSWQPPARNGGSPISEYVMTSDLPAPSWAQSKFVSCTVKAPATSCTMQGSTRVFDRNKTYTFSVVAKTERGTSPQATKKWKGEIYRLNIYQRTRIDSEVLLTFSAIGWPKDARGFEIQAKVGENGTWKKQGTTGLDPDYVGLGDWAGMLPKSVTGGSEVFYRIKSDKGYSNVVRFRLQSSFEYSVG
jgi:Fibronectin type III domain